MRVHSIMSGFFVIICACLLIMNISGCAKNPKQEKSPLTRHTGSYSATAKISSKQFQAAARISQEAPSSCTVFFESPPSLDNMMFTFRRDSVDLNYRGLDFTFALDSVPSGAAAQLMVAAINKALNGDGLITETEDGILEVNGLVENGEFRLTIEKETGNLIKLSIPGEELEIEFENFIFLD